MPTANVPQHIEWILPFQHTSDYSIAGSTPFFNSKSYCDLTASLNSIGASNSFESKIFIKLMQKIRKDIRHSSIENSIFMSYRTKIESSLSTVSEIQADAYSVELTEDETLFMSLKIGENTCYIEQYLDTEVNDVNDFVLTIFKDKQVVKNKSGNLSNIFESIQTIV